MPGAGRVDGLVQSGESGTCGYYVNDGPASVTGLAITYWLPSPSYVFSAASATPWSTLKRDTAKPNRTGTRPGATYYAYTTTYAGTGDPSTVCGPAYSFTAPGVPGDSDTPNEATYYQFSCTLNGVSKTNPLQAIKNP